MCMPSLLLLNYESIFLKIISLKYAVNASIRKNLFRSIWFLRLCLKLLPLAWLSGFQLFIDFLLMPCVRFEK